MIAIMRKDLREWFSGGATGRYGQYEFLIYIALFGIVFPLFFAYVGSSGAKRGGGLPPVGPLIGAALPIFLLIYAMADAFAGEKERGTFETLLVTPLRSSEIVLGKWFAGLAYAASIMLATTITASIVSRVMGSSTIAFGQLALVMAIALTLGGLLGAIEIIIALRAPTVKAAVFALNITFVVLAIGGTQLIGKNIQVIAPFFSRFADMGAGGLIALGGLALLSIFAAMAILLWIATRQVSAMRLE